MAIGVFREETKKAGHVIPIMAFRQPGCLLETLLAFRPILANGLVLSYTLILFVYTYRENSKSQCDTNHDSVT